MQESTHVPSTRSGVLKKNPVAKNRNTWMKWHYHYTWEIYPSMPRFSSFYHPNPLIQKAWKFQLHNIWRSCRQTIFNEQQPVLDASSPLTQADLPWIIKAVSTYLSTQPQHPPTTTPEDTSTIYNESEQAVNYCPWLLHTQKALNSYFSSSTVFEIPVRAGQLLHDFKNKSTSNLEHLMQMASLYTLTSY